MSYLHSSSGQFGTILCPEIGGSTMGVVRQLISGDAQAFDVMPGRRCILG